MSDIFFLLSMMSLSGAQYVGSLTYLAGVLCKHKIGIYCNSFNSTEIREKSEEGSTLMIGKCNCRDVRSKPRLASHTIILLSSDPEIPCKRRLFLELYLT